MINYKHNNIMIINNYRVTSLYNNLFNWQPGIIIYK